MIEKDVKLSFVPRPHQIEAHKKRKRFNVLVFHRRAGKTVFAIIELLLSAYQCKYPDGRYGYIAPFFGQAKQTAWTYLKKYALEIPGTIVKEGELSVKLLNGAVIRLFGGDNPDALRGIYFDGVVLDEVADMKTNIFGEIIRPALTDRQGWALFIGTPKGINLFSELYYNALKDPEWYACLKRHGDTKAIPESEVESARREMTPNQFAQEFECDFSVAVANALISLEMAQSAYGRKISLNEYHFAPKILGVDVARYGDDRSVIFPRQGLAALKPKVFQKMDTMTLANHIVNECVSWQPDAVFIDDIGVGGGVTDRLRQLGRLEIIPVISGGKATDVAYSNLRIQMWVKMKEWIEQGGCLPEEKGLMEDLCTPTYWYGDNGKMHLEATEDIKKRTGLSPDLGMALANTFAAHVEKRSDMNKFHSGKPNMCITDYPLFDEN